MQLIKCMGFNTWQDINYDLIYIFIRNINFLYDHIPNIVKLCFSFWPYLVLIDATQELFRFFLAILNHSEAIIDRNYFQKYEIIFS